MIWQKTNNLMVDLRKKVPWACTFHYLHQEGSDYFFSILLTPVHCPILCPVDTCPVKGLLLCLFAHCHVNALSFSEGLCFTRLILSSLCRLLQFLISTTTHMSLSNCRISPHHLILLRLKSFPFFLFLNFSFFFFSAFVSPPLFFCIHPIFVSPPLFFCVRPYFVSRQYSIFFPFLSNFLCFDF